MVPLWMADYFEKLGDYYDLNISQVFRLAICTSIIASVTASYPEYKGGINLKEIFEKSKALADMDEEMEEWFRFLSKLYFEARKAAEFMLKKKKVTK